MKENYKILKNLFERDKCSEMTAKLNNLVERGIYRNPDPLCKLSPAFYGIFNDQLTSIQKRVEEEVGEELYPCYSYARIYQENDSLPPHTDRPSCEISLTVTLGYEKHIWPIYLLTSGHISGIDLDIGDALIYKGTEVMHFRHPMQGQKYQYQVFFHYVRKNGPYADYRYGLDERLITAQEAESQNFPQWTDQNN